MSWFKEKRKIYAAVVLVLIIFLVVLAISRESGPKTVKPQISAFEEWRYLWIFNAYPPLDLARGENFMLSRSGKDKNKLISSLDFGADLGQTAFFFKNYLSKNGYSEIKNEEQNDSFEISAAVKGLPLVISAEKISGSLTRVTLVFEARNITRKPLHE